MKEHKDNTDLTVANRRAFVLKAYLSGRYPDDIYEEWQKMFPVLDKSSFNMDVHLMYQELKKRGQKDIDVIIDRHLDYLQDMYREARENNDLNVSVKILKEIRETLGIGGTKTKSISLNQTINNTTQLPPMSIEEIRHLLGKSSTGITDSQVLDITPESE